MSDQHDEQRAHTRRQRERQYEIDRITFEYATEHRNGNNPRIEDYVRRYPQYASELLEYALYFHTVGFDRQTLVGPAEPALSPAAEKAMARIRALSAQAAPVVVESLVQLGLRANYAPPQLAAAVGLNGALLQRLEAHAISAASIPGALIQRFADVLKTAPDAIRAYLGASPAGGFYMADQQPDQQQQTFLDAVETSALSPERKREWAEIVNAETKSGP